MAEKILGPEHLAVAGLLHDRATMVESQVGAGQKTMTFR